MPELHVLLAENLVEWLSCLTILHWWDWLCSFSVCVYLSVITVDVVKDSCKQIVRHIVKGDDGNAGKSLQSFTLAEMILQQRLKIITPTTEKRLRT